MLNAYGCNPPGLLDSWWASSTRRMDGGSTRTFANDCERSSWNCTKPRRGSSSSAGARTRIGDDKVTAARRRRSASSGSSTSAGGRAGGHFLLTRHTDPKRMRATLKAINEALKRRRHDPVPEQGRWLGSVVRGYLGYFAVPTNSIVVSRFRSEVIRHWRRHLCQRSQRHRLNWRRMTRLANRWLPPARIQHPWPDQRFHATTQGRSPVR